MWTLPYASLSLQSVFFLTCLVSQDCSSKYIFIKIHHYHFVIVKIQFQCLFFKNFDNFVCSRIFLKIEKPDSCKFFCRNKKFIYIYIYYILDIDIDLDIKMVRQIDNRKIALKLFIYVVKQLIRNKTFFTNISILLILTIIKHLQNVMRQSNFARICLHKSVFSPPPIL